MTDCTPFHTKIAVRWADVDANGHVRHTAYNDYAAHARIRWFYAHGMDQQWFARHHMGPILFTENTRFLREIKLDDDITCDVCLSGLSRDASRFGIRHRVVRSDGVLAAEIHVTGAWMDLHKRKLMQPPEKLKQVSREAARTEDFQVILTSKDRED